MRTPSALFATGKRIRAGHILVATGAAPSYGPTIPGIEHVISSNEAFDLPAFPRRVLVQGGSYIAVEFAGIFAGLGAKVTLVYRGDNILRGFDDDVRQHLRDEMERRGIRPDRLHGRLGREDPASSLRPSFQRHDGDRGSGDVRAWPSSECRGVRTPRSGGESRREWRDRGRRLFAHLGAAHLRGRRRHQPDQPDAGRDPRGHAFADTVFGGKPTMVDHANVPTAVFSEPEVGVVGLTEAQARARFAKVDIYKAMFRPMKATLSGRDTTVLLKLVVDGTTDRVVGCHVVGEGAGEMIQVLGIAVKMGATKADFDATMAVHPTAAEELVTMRTVSKSYGREAAE